jgi:peptidoglycan/xylan/chitin deacetylase (PgdA/CDA1 family)
MMIHLRLHTTLLLLALAILITPIPVFAAPPDNLVIEHGPRNSHNIAITFDACPTSLPDEYDKKVVDILIKEKVPATIFMSGRWVEKNPEKAKFLAAQPQFEIAAHSYYHPHMTEKPDDRIIREFKRTQAIIKKTTGKTPRYFRPPYCEVNERVVRLASLAGLTTIQYDVASGDPDPKLTPRKIVQGVLQDAKNGSIIVFHMNHKGVHTAEVLPEVINGLREKGFTLVTIGELLGNSQSQHTPSKQITNPTPTVPNTSDVGK